MTALTRWIAPGSAVRMPAAPVRDGAVALAFLLAMTAERLAHAPQLPALLLSAAVAGALALGRRAPLAAYLAGTVALAVEAQVITPPGPLSPYANLLGLYALGRYATRGRARLGPVVVLAGMAGYFGALAVPGGVLFLWLLTWALGYAAARRQEERTVARQVLRQRVVAEERARIARELHDVVGHTLNLMLVQAGAARRLLPRDPVQSGELLSGLEHTGREALDELDRVLGLLRLSGPADGDGSGSEDGPGQGASLQPGLADLPRLVGRLEQAGLRVTARVGPEVRQLPRTVDLSAYRIVQEALTNTVRHGRADTVEITVGREAEVLAIEVRDGGRGAPGGYTPGRGLLGIAERAAMFGGTVEHGSVAEQGGERGGFRLRVTLPLG
ncbi:histidine kinase [Kitasatospora sp. NPDC002040]|uniref:sensor histidine kinase n=1 Tax=Kitasatospora sp. NPDC002040 TaxID=3154661 RepID=UPI00332C5BFB